MAKSDRPLVFLSAFACEPGRGSEPGVGWEFVRAAATLARREAIKLVVLTRPHRLAQINAALESEHLNSSMVEIVGIPVPFHVHRAIGRRRARGAYIVARGAYIVWQVAAFRVARRLARREGRAPIYHHVSFATAALPTAGMFLPCNWTFIMGPAGSASAQIPTSMYEVIQIHLKSAISRLNVQRADVCIAQNDHVAQQWRPWAKHGTVLVEPNAMIDEVLLSTITEDTTKSKQCRIISVGLLRKLKRHDVVIRALAEPELNGCQLTIVGDGPEQPSLQRLAKELGVENRVEFTGWLPHNQTLTAIANAGCLVLASVSEGAGWAVAEAQALGVPVVVRANTGAETLVNIARSGTVASADVQPRELALIVNSSLRSSVMATDRWNRSRLPDTLLRWYSLG
jgi:glycosyltransferase involved in cell wall biosynthesis